MNLRNLVCTAFLVNVVWFTLVKLVEISQYVLRNTRRIARKPSKINLLWLNILGVYDGRKSKTWTYDHRIKWDEATILAIDSHKFSRKMRESIEIEKHNTIDQEGKPLDSTWRALFNVQNSLGPVYEFVCVSFTTGNLNCFRVK